MNVWWEKMVSSNPCIMGEKLRCVPRLCLLTESEFNRWARTPSRPLIAIAAAELSISIDGQCPLLHRLN